jgi:catechol 2,3-dioxygenase
MPGQISSVGFSRFILRIFTVAACTCHAEAGQRRVSRRTKNVSPESVFNVTAAFVELSTDKIDLFWRSVFIRVIRGRIQGEGDNLSLRFLMFTPEKDFRPIDPQVRIGHVHLKVSDLERSLGFYCGVLGFELMQRLGFISAGGYHHHIGLNTWESLGGSPPPPGSTGLFHVAILYPDRARLGDALRRLLAAKIPLEGASDHGVSEALYLRDPDENGVELYRDRAQDEWPHNPDGSIAMDTRPLDLDALLRDAYDACISR